MGLCQGNTNARHSKGDAEIALRLLNFSVGRRARAVMKELETFNDSRADL